MNPVILITGASRGIGAATALLAARHGYHLCINYLSNDEAAQAILSQVRTLGAKAIAVRADVSSEAEIIAMFQRIDKDLGPIAALVNNAATIAPQTRLEHMTESRLLSMMKTNIVGPMLCTKHAVLRMAARHGGNGGAIVNVSSISALRPRGLTTYSVSKSAVIGLTKAMAVDHGPEGIRVNCVAPGPVYTPMVYGRGMAPEARERRVRASVLGMEGTGWDIGHAVRFLASDHARYITGQVLVVDGGTTLRGPSRDT